MTQTITHIWHERTINGTRYQFEAQVDYLDRWRVNLHQQGHDGRWTTSFGSWQDGPKNDTHEEALVAFADRFVGYTRMRTP